MLLFAENEDLGCFLKQSDPPLFFQPESFVMKNDVSAA